MNIREKMEQQRTGTFESLCCTQWLIPEAENVTEEECDVTDCLSERP